MALRRKDAGGVQYRVSHVRRLTLPGKRQAVGLERVSAVVCLIDAVARHPRSYLRAAPQRGSAMLRHCRRLMRGGEANGAASQGAGGEVEGVSKRGEVLQRSP